MNILVPSEKDSLDGSRCFKSFLTLRMFVQSFLLTNFTIVLSFSLSRLILIAFLVSIKTTLANDKSQQLDLHYGS